MDNFLEKLNLHLATAPSPSRSRSALRRKLKKLRDSGLPALGLTRCESCRRCHTMWRFRRLGAEQGPCAFVLLFYSTNTGTNVKLN